MKLQTDLQTNPQHSNRAGRLHLNMDIGFESKPSPKSFNSASLFRRDRRQHAR
jgi:hypothetical protein